MVFPLEDGVREADLAACSTKEGDVSVIYVDACK